MPSSPMASADSRVAVDSSVIDGDKSIHHNHNSNPHTSLAGSHLGDGKVNDEHSVCNSKTSKSDLAQCVVSVEHFTSNAISAQPASKEPPSLLVLPPEIRLMVYRYLLSNMFIVIYDVPGRYNPTICPNILQTCRLIYNEALPILYGSNLFWHEATVKAEGLLKAPSKLLRHVKHLEIYVYLAVHEWYCEDDDDPSNGPNDVGMSIAPLIMLKDLIFTINSYYYHSPMSFGPQSYLVQACAGLRTVKTLFINLRSLGRCQLSFTDTSIDVLKASLIAEGSVEGRMLQIQSGRYKIVRTSKQRARKL